MSLDAKQLSDDQDDEGERAKGQVAGAIQHPPVKGTHQCQITVPRIQILAKKKRGNQEF